MLTIFLVYSGNTFESSGVYMFAAPELLGCDNDTILRILRNKSIGCDLVPKLDIGYNLNVYDITTKETDLNILVSKGEDSKGIPYYRVVANSSSDLDRHAHQSKKKNFSTDPFDQHLDEKEQ